MSHHLRVSAHNFQADERSSLLPLFTGRQPAQKKQCYHRIRKIRSKGAIIVLLSAFLVYGSFFAVYTMSTEGKDRKGAIVQDGPGAAAIIILSLSCPFAGWLADVHFGRYKVMRAGLWLMWIGTLYCGVILIFYHHYEHTSTGKNLLNYAGLVPAAILFTAGLAAFAVNTLQFGVDQMPDASAEEVSAFIHWFVWVMFAGEIIGILTNLIYDCTLYTISNKYGSMVETVIPATMISLALCCDFLFRGWLTIEPESQNPLKTVSGVLKYAATHKCAERPRAITYCEDERPSRIDFAKEKYGGPFTTEQVEDVKTCGRMLVVIASTAAFFIPVQLFILSRSYLQYHFQTNHDRCLKNIGYYEAVFATIGIPIYEVLVYPMIRNRIPSMLQRIGIGAILTIISNIFLLSIDTAGHKAQPSIPSLFNYTSKGSLAFDINYMWVGIPSNLLVAIQMSLFFIAIMEFTWAQAPHNMKGMLIGLVYSLIFSTYPIGYGIFVAWAKGDWKHKVEIKYWGPSYDFWYFLFQVLFAIVGFGILCIVAKWYKRRQRDEPPHDRAVLEAIYTANIAADDNP